MYAHQHPRAHRPLLLLALLCCLCLPAHAQDWGSSPENVLQGVNHALDTADATLFDTLVDTRAICQQGVKAFFDLAATPEGAQLMPPAVNLILSSMGNTPQARDTVAALLAGEAQNFVHYGVASGKFGGNPSAQPPQANGLLANLFANASLGRKELRHVGSATYTENLTATLPLEVYDHDTGRSYAVVAGFSKPAGAWRVSSIANMRALITQISREATQP